MTAATRRIVLEIDFPGWGDRPVSVPSGLPKALREYADDVQSGEAGKHERAIYVTNDGVRFRVVHSLCHGTPKEFREGKSAAK